MFTFYKYLNKGNMKCQLVFLKCSRKCRIDTEKEKRNKEPKKKKMNATISLKKREKELEFSLKCRE